MTSSNCRRWAQIVEVQLIFADDAAGLADADGRSSVEQFGVLESGKPLAEDTGGSLACSRPSISPSVRSSTLVPSSRWSRVVLMRQTPSSPVRYMPTPLRGIGNSPASRAWATSEAKGRKSCGCWATYASTVALLTFLTRKNRVSRLHQPIRVTSFLVGSARAGGDVSVGQSNRLLRRDLRHHASSPDLLAATTPVTAPFSTMASATKSVESKLHPRLTAPYRAQRTWRFPDRRERRGRARRR